MTGSFDFILDKLEIKILILLILRRLPEPVTLEELAELTMFIDGISYFDLTECVAELLRTGHVDLEDDKYRLTQKGVRNGMITENNLAHQVLSRAKDSTAAFRAAKNRNSNIKTSHSAVPEGGCIVSLSLSDGVGEIVAMELFAANEKQAMSLEKGFRKNAESIYNSLIEAILE